MTPAALAVIGALLLLLLALFAFRASRAPPAPRAAARARRAAVLVAGAADAGKTALLHALVFGRAVETVTSARVASLVAPLHGAPAGAPRFDFTDVPGAAAARAALVRGAADAGAVLLVVDAAGGAAAVAGAGAILFDIFTDARAARGGARLLVVANKADARGALAPAALRAALTDELNRLRASRGALRETAGGGGDGDDEPAVPLGEPGRPFSFDAAPLATAWCAASAAPGGVPRGSGGVKAGDVQAVADFLAAGA